MWDPEHLNPIGLHGLLRGQLLPLLFYVLSVYSVSCCVIVFVIEDRSFKQAHIYTIYILLSDSLFGVLRRLVKLFIFVLNRAL
jgi:hypothetical protein